MENRNKVLFTSSSNKNGFVEMDSFLDDMAYKFTHRMLEKNLEVSGVDFTASFIGECNNAGLSFASILNAPSFYNDPHEMHLVTINNAFVGINALIKRVTDSVTENFKNRNTGSHGRTDRLPLWYGNEKTFKKGVPGSIKSFFPEFNTANIRSTVTYKMVAVGEFVYTFISYVDNYEQEVVRFDPTFKDFMHREIIEAPMAEVPVECLRVVPVKINLIGF